jgi:hypothetical protein
MYTYYANIKNAEKKITTLNLRSSLDSKFKLLTEPELDYSKEEINEIINFISKEHYTSLKNKLLHMTRHPIENNKLKEWVNQQPSEQFKIAAMKFANNIIYTNYENIINTVETICERLLENYEKSVIILGTKKEKSTFYFSILVASCIYEKYGILPFSICKNFISGFQKFGTNVTYLDIDDMMYTGSQTLDLLFRYIDALDYSFQIDSKTKVDKVVNLLLKHEYLINQKLDYKLVRLFMSTHSMKECLKNKNIILPFEIITDKELIPTFKESIVPKEYNTEDIIDFLIIKIFFNLDYPSITCSYFDYKIADLASASAFPLLTGYIPSTDFINYFLNSENIDDIIYEELRDFDFKDKDSLIKEFKEKLKIDSTSDYKFINFIKNCYPKNDIVNNFNEIEFHTQYGVFQEEKNIDNNLINDCPKPFYKKENLFFGKTRNRKSRKSRKKF